MLNIPYTSITKEYQYSYLLHILIRTMWLVNKTIITRLDFVIACKEKGISKTSAYRYWEKWAFKNKFIKYVSKDKETIMITWKKHFDTLIENVPEYIYSKVVNLITLKDFLLLARLWNSWINNWKAKIKTGVWLRKLASEVGSSISTISRRVKRLEEKNWLSVWKRFWECKGLIVRLVNVYTSSIRVIKNKYCKMNNTIRRSIKTFTDAQFLPLLSVIKSKITKKLIFATPDEYDHINPILYPKII